MKNSPADEQDLTAEKLKFKVKQREVALSKQKRALDLNNIKMLGRLGGGASKFDSDFLPKAITLRKGNHQKDSSIDSSIEKHRMYEK